MSLRSIVAPRLMLIGSGAVAEVAAVLAQFGLSRPLVVTDPFMVSSGLLRRCIGPLEQSGIHAEIFAETVPDPTDTVVEAGVRMLDVGDFDSLIGFGGGSPIDTAKAMTISAFGGGHIRQWKFPIAADHARVPVIAIPTTAGTGSEATRFTVITDTEYDEKMLIAGLGALPLAALVDYELTFGLPKRITADTGIDTFTHALEAYVSRHANPFSDAYALSAMELVGAHLRTAYTEPRNVAAREGMMLAATQAGLAFSNSSVALVHGMSRPIGAHFHVPHGMSNAMLLPFVTSFGLRAAEARYAEAGRRVGLASAEDEDAVAADKLARGLAALNEELEVPSPATFGIDRAVWDSKLAVMADQALGSGSPANNPRVPDKDEILALYRAAWTGVPLNF